MTPRKMWALFLGLVAIYMVLIVVASAWYWRHDPLVDQMSVEREMGRR